MRVGVIGLGHMGRLVAQKLAEAGHEMHGWDRDPEAADGLDLRLAGSPTELATRVEVAFSVLADDAVVRDVVIESGVLGSLPQGALFADLSTTSVDLVLNLAQAASEAGVAFLDVEMSGSTPTLEQGELALLVGGDPAVLERMRPLLEPLAKSIHLLGDVGAGAKMKLVVNTMLGVEMQALAEAIALGEGIGLDRDKLLDALEEMAVVSAAHKGKIENARTGEYPVQFALRLMDKDFGLVLRYARDAGVFMPATEASADVCARVHAQAGEDVDFSAVIAAMRQQVRV